MHSLLAVGHAAEVHQVDDTVAEHLAVDTEIFVAFQKGKDSVRDAADTELQSGAVIHEVLGDVLADELFLLARLVAAVRQQRAVMCYRDVDVALVDERVAEGARHVLVHLGCEW